MLKTLMHSLIGGGPVPGMTNMTNAQIGQLTASDIVRSMDVKAQRYPGSKKIFDGRIEVNEVANGYVVNIALKEGYAYTTHIASSITEVNQIIAASMVAFQLEN